MSYYMYMYIALINLKTVVMFSADVFHAVTEAQEPRLATSSAAPWMKLLGLAKSWDRRIYGAGVQGG